MRGQSLPSYHPSKTCLNTTTRTYVRTVARGKTDIEGVNHTSNKHVTHGAAVSLWGEGEGEESLYNGNYIVMLFSCVCICMHMYVMSHQAEEYSTVRCNGGHVLCCAVLCHVIAAVSNNVLSHSIYF